MTCYMYILLCANGTYYTGSTKDLDRRIEQHMLGLGANYTKKHTPVKLVYFEEFDRIDFAFEREKQIQNWSKSKKEALINRDMKKLKASASCENETRASRLALDDLANSDKQ